MKVAIITILDGVNFGTYLQAYSLCSTIRKENINVELIRYERRFTGIINSIADEWYKKKSISRKIWGTIARLFVVPIIHAGFLSFIKKNIMVSRKYSSLLELKKEPPIADIYFTGSDQVWNTKYNRGIDRAYFLDFLDEKAHRYSYASSIGMDDFDKRDKSIIMELLNRYHKITVREISAIRILSSISIYNVEAVLDPIFLTTKDEWNTLAKKNDGFKKEEQYLLIYCVEPNKMDDIMTIAVNIANQKKLKIYLVECSFSISNLRYKVDKRYTNASVYRFINLLLNADFVVASSFHGTAFSINFNINFFVILPDYFNSRIIDLLDLFDLIDYKIETKCIPEINIKDIDYRKVNIKLDTLKEISLNTLRTMLKDSY